jgi:hypothetical protein
MGTTVEISSQAYRVTQERNAGAFSISTQDDAEGWGMMILSIAVGLLALGFFLALGGIFALVGPWMVFAAIHLFRQKWARKAGGHLGHQAIQLVVSIRNHAILRQAGGPWGKSSNCFANGQVTGAWLADSLLP